MRTGVVRKSIFLLIERAHLVAEWTVLLAAMLGSQGRRRAPRARPGCPPRGPPEVGGVWAGCLPPPQAASSPPTAPPQAFPSLSEFTMEKLRDI